MLLARRAVAFVVIVVRGSGARDPIGPQAEPRPAPKLPRGGPTRLDPHPDPPAPRLPRGRAGLRRAAGGRARRRADRGRGRPGRPRDRARSPRSTARATSRTASRAGSTPRATPRSRPRTADLLCFLDDDVEAWPGWLGALLAAADEHPEHEAFGGPIRAQLEGTNLHACGREPPPVTTLDLGPDDRDAEFVWGANLTLRRSALERVGELRPRPRPLRRRGGLAAAPARRRRAHPLRGRGRRRPPPHGQGRAHRRRSRAPPTAAGATRAATTRARASRRRLAAELRTLAGCVWHIVRRRCGNGIVLTRADARAAARGAAARSRCRASTRDPDYLSGRSGTLGRRGAARRAGCATRAPTCAPRAPRRRLRPQARSRAARGACSCSRRRAAGERPRGGATIGHELGASHHDALLRIVAAAPRAPASGPTSTRRCRPPAARLRLAADRRRRRRAARTTSSTSSSRSPSATASGSPSPRTRSPRTPPGRSPAARPGADRAAHALRRDRPGDRDPRRRVRRRCSRSPTSQMGWGLDAHWARAWPRRGAGSSA